MKEIQLTQGYIALVDDEDFERVNQYKWHACVKPTRNTIYARTNVGTKTLLMHRFVLGLTDPKIQADHKDRDGRNNQKYNLRTTKDKNQCNTLLRKDNASGFKGVVWRKSLSKWQAQIGHNKKKISLGYFSNPLEAACAYDMAAVKYHGEFASTNFVEPS